MSHVGVSCSNTSLPQACDIWLEITNLIGLGSFLLTIGWELKLELGIDKQLGTRTRTRTTQSDSLELELELDLDKQTAWN